MDIKKIAPELSVSPQLRPQDVGVAAAQGFRSIIINRPDNEGSDQPTYADIEETARSAGLKVSYIPVTPGNLTDADIEAFAKAMQELPAPVLAFCRTGTRSITLWALSQAGHLSVDAILETALDAGYDLGALQPRLDAKELAVSGGVGPVSSNDILIVGEGLRALRRLRAY